jgi:superoxide dismutase
MQEMQEMPELVNDTEMLADYRVRRREQNRAAQRAFRERRAKYVKDLEHQLMEIQERYSRKEDEVTKLIIRIKELTMEINLLRNTNPGFFHNGMGHQTPSTPFNIYNAEIIDSEGEISGK